MEDIINILHTVFSFNNGGIENLIVDMLNNWNIDSDNLVLDAPPFVYRVIAEYIILSKTY